MLQTRLRLTSTMSSNPEERRGRGTPPSERMRVRRLPRRGVYDRAAIDAILDEALVAHLGFTHESQVYVVPTLQARIGGEVYVHGSAASRTLRSVAVAPACLTVTQIDGLVLARSVFEHSINYRSVMLLGELRLVDDDAEKRAALEAFTNRLLPGRWDEARQPSAQELKATSILALPINEASAKVRTGPPDDGASPDAELDVWAGVLPLELVAGTPQPDPLLREGIPLPPSIRRYLDTV
jgi:nitroimidazol reductase NimA-like FMN-containing flavoprotein (pyridoxamine 5'-phosphate oxidase superfamily)